ncbi:MAG: protein kinase domain-containing protein [Kofleriaceae bacterium]
MYEFAPTAPFDRFEDIEIHVDLGDVDLCPDENLLAELVQGLLSIASSSKLEHHLDTCESCRRTVSSVGQSSYAAARRTRIDSGRAAELVASARVLSTSTLSSRASATPAPGTILAGKYRVEGVIGQGGMGIVLAATHLTLGKLVALKIMRPDLAVDPLATQRFVREARAASQLRSEHIARVIDLDTLDDGAPYIAMEYLEGDDLGAVLALRGTLPIHEAAVYIAQVCDAIAEAHASGIVHRDLKPANLFLTHRANTPCIKVLDFGVSKILAGGPLADDVADTDTRAIVGSPHYMAPEQLVSAKSVDPRTDIWALGCILFELVSGTSPFNTGAALAHVMASILRDPAQIHSANVPPPFLAIIERCLQKDPAQRFHRVEDLAAALQPFTAPPAAATVTPTVAIHRRDDRSAPDRAATDHAATDRVTSTARIARRSKLRSVGLALITGIVVFACALFVVERSLDDAPALGPAASPTLTQPIGSGSVTAPLAPPMTPARIATPAPPARVATPSITSAPQATTPPPTHTLTPAPSISPPKARVRTTPRPRPARPGLEADLIGPSF